MTYLDSEVVSACNWIRKSGFKFDQKCVLGSFNFVIAEIFRLKYY